MRDYDRYLIAGARDSADAALERARRAAPGDAHVQAFVVTEFWSRYGGRGTRNRYRGWNAGDPDVSACIQTATDWTSTPVTNEVEGVRAFARLEEIGQRPAAATCVRLFSALLNVRTSARSTPTPEMLRELEQLAADETDVPLFRRELLRALLRRGVERAPAICARYRPTIRFAVTRMEWETSCAEAFLELGDTVRARASYRVLEDAVRRDGRPGVRMHFFVFGSVRLHLLADPSMSTDVRLRRTSALAREIGDHWQLFGDLGHLGRWLIDRGDATGALAALDSAVALADSVYDGRDLARARVWRGRALYRLGQMDAARQNLRLAIPVLTDSGDTYDLAEAWHNLAHVYERDARWAEAAAAADRFAALTASFRWDGLRVMGRRDASEIKRKAGWMAAADEDARAMVDVIRDQDQNHQWGGEYFERRGELRAALEMYRLGVEHGVVVDPLDVAGMARMYTALGRLDSAALSARRHDAMRADWRPGEVPLLPDVLAAQGEIGVAARVLADWAATRSRGADLHGAALAQLAWGRMALRARDLNSAERAALAADSLATRAASENDAAAARLLRARVLSMRGQRTEALALARSAAGNPALRDFPLLRVEAFETFGDVGAGALREDARLTVYADAAAIVDAVSVGLTDDRDRAGYRARQLAPFDSALAISARLPANAAEVTRWSSRRKSAALRLAVGGDRVPELPSLSALQRRVGPNALFVDISVLEHETLLLVVSARTARAVRVPVGATAVDSLVLRARRGMDAVSRGRVDVARIRVDTTALRRLSDALLAPIAQELRGASRLLISTDGALRSLPLEMLPRPAKNDLVLDAFAVRYVPGAWAVGSRPTAARGPVLVVSQPAPGAADELRAVQSAWSGRTVRTLEGALATEESLEAQRRGVGVLHLLAHAIADPLETDASHLRLARSEVNDGFLHVREVSAWRGAPPLVVLSACATASGASLLGEGPFSLTRAFLRAGSREVIATQWPVGAAAARFSEVLHRELARGRSTEDAVATARRALRADTATSHPFYWAPFILVANDAP